VIRDASRDDRDAIVGLYLQLKRHHGELVPEADRYTVTDERWTHMVVKDFDDPVVHFIVAVEDGRPLAFARFFYEERSQGKACEVETLVVDEEVRGRRVGTAMLAHIEERARTDGATGMRVNVLDVNADGRRFYEGSGYETVAVRYAKKL
jgi:GNAT superfamily N-acetyltransferase